MKIEMNIFKILPTKQEAAENGTLRNIWLSAKPYIKHETLDSFREPNCTSSNFGPIFQHTFCLTWLGMTTHCRWLDFTLQNSHSPVLAPLVSLHWWRLRFLAACAPQEERLPARLKRDGVRTFFSFNWPGWKPKNDSTRSDETREVSEMWLFDMTYIISLSMFEP